MTLDFKKLIINAVKKQMAVQHFECNVQIFKKEELPENVAAKLAKAFGDSFLADANYTLWFSGNNITKDTIEKTLFKIANKAMGEAANNMNESDLKLVNLGGGTTPSAPQDTTDDVETMADAGADAANADAISDLVGSEDEAKQDDETVDPEATEIVADEPEPVTDEEIDSIDDEPEDGDADVEPVTDEEIADDGDSDDSDDEEDLDESVESPAAGEKFVLLKITMK